MSKSRSRKPTRSVSERDRFWLDHHKAQGASEQTARDYAIAQGLAPQAFYQARKRLRSAGLLPAGRAPVAKKSAGSPALSFSKITVERPSADPQFRLALPGEIVLEWSGVDVPESIASLLERLVRSS